MRGYDAYWTGWPSDASEARTGLKAARHRKAWEWAGRRHHEEIHPDRHPSDRDFGEICGKVQSLATYAANIHSRVPLPSAEWQKPALVIALQNRFQSKVARETFLRNHEIEKLVQGQILRKAGLPMPPAVQFRFGMKPDPIRFGEFVLLKPMDFRLFRYSIGAKGIFFTIG